MADAGFFDIHGYLVANVVPGGETLLGVELGAGAIAVVYFFELS